MKLKKILLAMIIALVALRVFIFAAGQIDFQRVVNGKKPMFARVETPFKDGGSVQYAYLAYNLTDMHQPTKGQDGMYFTGGAGSRILDSQVRPGENFFAQAAARCSLTRAPSDYPATGTTAFRRLRLTRLPGSCEVFIFRSASMS